jgi:hypothetical protein
MTIPRQIGWSQETNLLHSISKQLDRAISILTCCTTSTTTTIAPTTTTTSTILPLTTTTTTSTTCELPEDVVPDEIAAIYDAYTLIGPEEVISFINSIEEACEAISVVEAEGIREPQWSSINLGHIPANGNPETYYNLDTNCPLNGYYVICGAWCSVYYIIDGIIISSHNCTTTTTTTHLPT